MLLPELGIPPVLDFLQQKKKSFTELIDLLGGDNWSKEMTKDVKIEEIVEKAICLLD